MCGRMRLTGAKSLEAGGARRVVQQSAREPALREPGQRPPRGQERQQRVPVCAGPAPTCRCGQRHAAPVGALCPTTRPARSSSPATVRAGHLRTDSRPPMKTLQSGSYQRLASQDALWWAWRDCRRGKRRNPTIARFEIDCDRHLLALQRELLDYRYRPSPWRLHSDPRSQNSPYRRARRARSGPPSRLAARNRTDIRTPLYRAVVRRRSPPWTTPGSALFSQMPASPCLAAAPRYPTRTF